MGQPLRWSRLDTNSCIMAFRLMRRQSAANRNDDKRGQRKPNGVRRETGPVITASLHQHAGKGWSEKTTKIAEGTEETEATSCRRAAQEG